MMGALTWGLSLEEVQDQIDPDAYKSGNALQLKGISIYNFQGDCGAIYICGANRANKEKLKAVEKYASLSGFSKIFATVVSEKEYINPALEAFKSCRWKCVVKGKSNRNNNKDDYVFVKYIRNCKYKGY